MNRFRCGGYGKKRWGIQLQTFAVWDSQVTSRLDAKSTVGSTDEMRAEVQANKSLPGSPVFGRCIKTWDKPAPQDWAEMGKRGPWGLPPWPRRQGVRQEAEEAWPGTWERHQGRRPGSHFKIQCKEDWSHWLMQGVNTTEKASIKKAPETQGKFCFPG